MLKARSKPKIKQSVAFMKKPMEDKLKKCEKQPTKRKQQKENIHDTHKFAMTAFNSKKKNNKASREIQSSREVSPLFFNRKKNGEKHQDEKFIEKLFDKGYSNNNYKNNSLFVQKLIEGLVSHQKGMPNDKPQSLSHGESIDFAKQLHIKNQYIASLQNQIYELKLNISTFSLKVFDLTLVCRKNTKTWMDQIHGELQKKTDEVIACLDSLIKRWKLEQKIKTHCEELPSRLSAAGRNSVQNKKRCHTESLKIPIEEYLQSLQHTQCQRIGEQFSLRKNEYKPQQQQSEQIIKILSRRSSEVKKQQEQIYVVIRPFQSMNQHQLTLKIGERVSVMQKTNSNKWLGLKDGKLGYFPKECLF